MAAVYERGAIGRRLATARRPDRVCVEDAKAFIWKSSATYETKTRLLLQNDFPVLPAAALVFEHVCAHPHNGVDDARAAIEVCYRRLGTVHTNEGFATLTQHEIAIRAILNSPILTPWEGGPLLPLHVAHQVMMLQQSGMPITYTRGDTNNATFTLCSDNPSSRASVRVDNLEAWSHKGKFGVYMTGKPKELRGAQYLPLVSYPAAVFLAVYMPVQGGRGRVVPYAVPGLVDVRPVLPRTGGVASFKVPLTYYDNDTPMRCFAFVFDA